MEAGGVEAVRAGPGKPGHVGSSESEDAQLVCGTVRRRPAVSGKGGLAERRGRPGYAAMAARGGEVRMAVVVAARGGRWAREVRARRGGTVRGLLEARGVALGAGEAEGAVGMAVFDGWRCVEQEAGSEGTFALMETWKKGQKKEVRGFLEHRVLASCAFRSVPALPQDWEYMPAEMAGRRAVEQLRGRGPAL